MDQKIVLLMAAMAAAGYSREDANALCEVIQRGAVRPVLCRFEDSGEQFWLIEAPNAWPPQNCFLKDWPRLRIGVAPNPNFCNKCGHDSSQPDASCTCVCHDIFAVVLGYPADDAMSEGSRDDGK